jgi:hypothetical protein
MDESAPYHLDIEGLEETHAPSDGGGGFRGRSWVGIRFDCCGVYTRVYRSSDGTAYRGSCPRCLRKIRLRVGEGGTSSRFFVAE